MSGAFYTIKFRAAQWEQLKALGYDVIPLRRGKDSPYKGWPKMANSPASIAEWNGSGAAVRMKGSELFVIDLDIHVAEVRDKMLDWLTEHHPTFMKDCLRRHSQRVTLALIGRCVTAKGTQKTARYKGEGTDPKGDFVEIFTGNSKKYVGVIGVHTPRPGQREYDFHGRSILDTPVDQLPWFPDSEIAPMKAAFEKIMVDHGWEKVIPVVGNEAAGTKVYDLEPDMIFTLSDGEKVTLKELEESFEGYVHASAHDGGTGKITGYADLWDVTGGSQHSNTRVIVTIGAEGLCLYDCKYDVRHRWKHCAPPDHRELGNKLRELMALMTAKAEAAAMAEAGVIDEAEWAKAEAEALDTSPQGRDGAVRP